jgi:hypothetical protein
MADPLAASVPPSRRSAVYDPRGTRPSHLICQELPGAAVVLTWCELVLDYDEATEPSSSTCPRCFRRSEHAPEVDRG